MTTEQKAAIKVVSRDPRWFRYNGDYRLIRITDVERDPQLARAFMAAWQRRPDPFPPGGAA